MVHTIFTILSFILYGISISCAFYMFYTIIRDDIRSERERKEKMKNEQ